MEKIIRKTRLATRTCLARLSEINISYRPKIKPSEMVIVKTSKEAYALLMESWDMDTIHLREEFKLMIMNHSGRVKGIHQLSIGGLTGTIADPRIILAISAACLATGVILAHNHPSYATSPSDADLKLTEKVKNALALIDIKLLDHLIVTPDTYLSMSDEGLL